MRVSKWGNSLGVRLPKALVARMALRPGDELTIVAATDGVLGVDKTDGRADVLARMAARAWTPPAGYAFDRDEANAR